MNIPRTRLWGFILLFAGFIIGIPGILMMVAPNRYEATAQIKVPPHYSDPQSYDPYFFQTEFEVLQSEAVLEKVVNTLHLDVEWGKRYNYGKTIPRAEALGLLKQCLDLKPVRNTMLIEIGAISEDPEEAAKIANAVAEAYRDYRQEQDLKSQPASTPIALVELIESAHVPTSPVGANNPTGKILLGIGLFTILAGTRLLWRAYFAAPRGGPI